MLLRFAHLGGSHHLHCFGDLRGVADRFDPAPYVLRVRHSKLQTANYGLQTMDCGIGSSDLIAKSF
jgi:hypothetical protein